MSYVLQLKGRLAELKQERLGLVNAIKSHARSLKDLVALVSLQPLEELDEEAVFFHASELRAKKAGYLSVSEDIKRIKRELGEE